MLFGRERIALDRQGLTVESQALVSLGIRTIPLDELITFREFQQERDDSVERGLEVVSLGVTQRLLAGLSLLELEWLRDQLQDHLAQLQAEVESGPYWEHLRAHIDGQPTPADLRTGWQTVPLHSDRREVLRRTDAHPTWPSDSPWRFDDDFDGVTFLRRGKRSLVTLWGLLFVNGFWNGIVGVFVLLLLGVGRGDHPEGMGWWGLFFFLLPFEAVGTGLFVGLLWEVIQPYSHTSWQIAEGRVRCDWQAFGLYSRTWDSPLDQVARLEVRPSELSQTRPVWFRNGAASNRQSSTSEPGYVLVWVSMSNADLAEIPKLSEGEARCVAEAVLQRFPEWNAA